MFLGIEIGGTKLQVGVGSGREPRLVEILQQNVRPEAGAAGILEDVSAMGRSLLHRHTVTAVGIGFGGPIDCITGRCLKSHHVAGWDDFPLSSWAAGAFSLPVAIGNDCDVAGLGESTWGAGKGTRCMLYVTVGTGIGGGLILDGKIHQGFGLGAAEIGHLRPGLHAESPDQIVEAWSAGWGIAEECQARLGEPMTHRLGDIRRNRAPRNEEDVRQRLIELEELQERYAGDLLERCNGNVPLLTTKMVAEAAKAGNLIAQDVMADATRCLGWALAQAMTLIAPEVIVIGGGVSEIGEEHFLRPLRDQIAKYVFPVFAPHVKLAPALLGKEVVVHGAVALAERFAA